MPTQFVPVLPTDSTDDRVPPILLADAMTSPRMLLEAGAVFQLIAERLATYPDIAFTAVWLRPWRGEISVQLSGDQPDARARAHDVARLLEVDGRPRESVNHAEGWRHLEFRGEFSSFRLTVSVSEPTGPPVTMVDLVTPEGQDDTVPSVADPLLVRCSLCGSEAGQECETSSGRPAHMPHAVRFEAAREVTS